MSYNGSGVFNLYTPGNPVVTGTVISSTWANNTLNDIATGLSTAVTKDGQTTATSRVPFAAGISTFGVNLEGSSGSTQVGFLQGGTGAVATTQQVKDRQVVSPEDFGAVADGQWITDATISLATPTKVTSASNPWTAGDVGKRIIIWGAGTGTNSLVATISAYVSAGELTINTAASTAVAGVQAQWGTDNWQPFQYAATRLLALGGGTLRAQGKYFICHGADGNATLQHNLYFDQCSNITFDFSGSTLLGTFSGNAGNGGSTNKNYRVRVVNATIRPVGDRVEAPESSTTWNAMTFIYAEEVQILGPTIYVPAGCRAISIQSDTSIGTGVRLKNILIDDYMIIGPSDAATQYLSDGIDLATNGASDIWQNVTIGDGMVINCGKGIYAASSGTYQQRNLTIGNLQIINPRTQGATLFGIDGLTVGSLTINGVGKSASAGTYNGYGLVMNENNRVSVNNLVITGEDVAGLGAGLSINGTAPEVQRFGNVTIDTKNTANKWTNGIVPTAEDLQFDAVMIGNATTGVANTNKRFLCRALTFRDCTANFNSTLTLPNEHILDARTLNAAAAPTIVQTMPGVLAVNSADDLNVTGDGTTYTIICDSEVYDNTANYNNATGVFTAPLTGQYSAFLELNLDEIGAAHTGLDVRIITSNRTYIVDFSNPYAQANGATLLHTYAITDIDMDAADTMSCTVKVSGGTKTVDVVATFTRFGVHLNR